MISFGILAYTFIIVNDRQMQIKMDIERSRTLKNQAYRGSGGVSRQEENHKENFTGRTMF